MAGYSGERGEAIGREDIRRASAQRSNVDPLTNLQNFKRASRCVATGKSGTRAKTDVVADQISASEFDGIILPGGYAPDHVRRYPAMVKLVKELFEAQKVVAAICHAGWMLASAHILKGRKVTSVPAIKDDMIHAGADWVDQEVMIDGKLITSRKPDDLPAFMRAVIGEVA